MSYATYDTQTGEPGDEPFIILMSSTRCKYCKLMKPEWMQFLQDVVHYEHLLPEKFVRHFNFNPMAPGSAATKKLAQKYSPDVPALLFYLVGEGASPKPPPTLAELKQSAGFRKSNKARGSEARGLGEGTSPRDISPSPLIRWKPYWSVSPTFRTARSIILTILALLTTGLLDYPGFSYSDEVNDFYTAERQMEQLDELQKEFDLQSTPEEMTHPRYPNVYRICALEQAS
jgi:hypothetical protein